MGTVMNKSKLLDRLMENALDFLDRAVDDLEKHPKFSLINFYTAVELFLKARLMMEHWTLVVSSKQEPDLDKFQRGDFQSVTLDLANDRLTRVAKSGLTSQELKIIKDVGIHRNQMVHFFHVSSAKGEADAARRGVVRLQLTAWYALHNVLTGQWAEKFKKWKKQVVRIDRNLRKQKEYLKVVFDNKTGDLAQLRADGVLLLTCPSCSFKARKHEKDLDSPYKAECLVCGLEDTCINIECDNCKRLLRFVGDGYTTCKCGREYSPDDLAEALTDQGAALVAAMEGDFTENANCGDCDGHHSVVEIEGEYFCTGCFGLFDHIEFCGCCNEGNTSDMEHSAWSGCNHCDGRAGWDRD